MHAQRSQGRSTLISLGSDEFIFIWDVKQGQQIWCIQQSCRYYYHKIAFSSDGKFLAQQNEIRIWEIKVGKIVNILEGQSNQRDVMAFKPGASILATLSKKENKIKLWELNIQKSLGSYEGHKFQVMFIQFSPDYQKLSTLNNQNMGCQEIQIKLLNQFENNRCSKNLIFRKWIILIKLNMKAIVYLIYSPEGNLFLQIKNVKEYIL